MDTLEQNLAAELDLNVTRQVRRAQSPLSRQAAVHRDAIARHNRDILAIQRERDLTVRGYEGDLAEAETTYLEASGRLLRLIAEAEKEALERITVRQTLKKSSEAALRALEPTPAEKEAPIEARRVPRHPEPANIPPMVHRNIQP